MRHFRNALVVAVLAAAVFFAPARPAHACSCLQQTYEEHFAAADAVFDGITQGFVGNENASTYEFKVMETFKGSVPDPAFVRTPKDSAACGSNFDKDVAYRVFVKKENGALTTNLCMGNIESADAPPLTTTTAPGPAPTKPPPSTTSPTTTASDPDATTSTTGDDTVAINESDDGGFPWGIAVLVGAIGLIGVGAFAIYQRSRRTDPAQ